MEENNKELEGNSLNEEPKSSAEAVNDTETKSSAEAVNDTETKSSAEAVNDTETNMAPKMSRSYTSENNNFLKKEVRPRKRFSFLKGSIVGFTAAVLVIVLLVSAFVDKGYIKVGINGEIYVQDTPVTDADAGIGEKVTDKLDTLEQVLGGFYFDEVDDAAAAENIYKAYLSSYGDKYTVYYTAEEYKAITQATSGTYYGIGVVVSKNDDGTIKVVLPYENCPGSEAGMLIGDTIIKVNGTSVIDRDLSAVVADIKGAEGSKVEIEIVREGNANPIVLSVERRKIEIPTIASKMLSGNIGYIEITEFDEVTYDQFVQSYKDLKAQGMVGLVIDIRSNPGGLLSTVVNMLDEILPDGMIVYTETKDGKRTEYKGKNSNQISVPLTVLVNGDSASASEIFAGAVQDYGVGTIVGTTTFGKGIVQTIRPLTDGSAVKYTIAKYFTPKGQDIHGKGVTPDVVVDIDAAVKNKTNISVDEDNQLQKALEIIRSKIAK